MASIGPVTSEEKMVENVDGQPTADAYLYYKLNNEPLAQVRCNVGRNDFFSDELKQITLIIQEPDKTLCYVKYCMLVVHGSQLC